MTVWSWNGKRAEWGTNTQTELAAGLSGMGDADRMRVRIESPEAWLSVVTFLDTGPNLRADPTSDLGDAQRATAVAFLRRCLRLPALRRLSRHRTIARCLGPV